jgi:putative phosphoribosyl transferase
MHLMLYENREEAGALLGDALSKQPKREYDLVLGLCRGGLPVAAVVAEALGAPLEVLVVRKLSAPGNPELAMGAISEFGAEALNPSVLRAVRGEREELARTRSLEERELQRRTQAYRSGRALALCTGLFRRAEGSPSAGAGR